MIHKYTKSYQVNCLFSGCLIYIESFTINQIIFNQSRKCQSVWLAYNNYLKRIIHRHRLIHPCFSIIQHFVYYKWKSINKPSFTLKKLMKHQTKTFPERAPPSCIWCSKNNVNSFQPFAITSLYQWCRMATKKAV